MSVDFKAKIFRGYKLPQEAINGISDELRSNLDSLLHPLNGYDENSDYILGIEIDSVEPGDAKYLSEYDFECYSWCSLDNKLLDIMLDNFKPYMDDCFPRIYFALTIT